MLKKLSVVAAILVLAASLIVASFDDAEAKRGRRGAFFGGLALGALAIGALSAAEGRGYYEENRCYRGPRRCHWVRGECYRDSWGEVECEPGYRSCYRPLVCE
ncbi:MAG: hypothetical protein HC850_01905 [Rhodomicrobium sp.]|nr:hypothetical protein [Rhodomicrobium sp.]